MRHDTAGDPMTGLKWTRRTTAKLAAELASLGIEVSARTVARLLRQMRFSLCANQKKLSGRSPRERDAQFGRIAKLRHRCASRRLPIISVDTKKKEMVGLFKNPGRAWTSKPLLVNDHDFRSEAEGMAVPYGILDMLANRGTLFVGTSHDTPHFAVDAIEKWWRTEGRDRYPDAQHLAVLADAGGSNGPTCRAWKHGLQTRICDRHGLTVTVAHYPTGASKWNPIEHRLFSEISKNWAGRPLDSYQTILNHIRTTRTTTGLRVRAHLVRRYYKKKTRISDAEMRDLRVAPNKALPKWNYTLRPA
jgi:hypothetical protein